MFRSLLGSRRFAPLFWCQFFSAFNDNFVRNMLAMFILFRLGEVSSGAYITLAVAIFIFPTLLLSGVGGEMADACDKAYLAKRLKCAEIFVQMVAASGFLFESLSLLYLALFGLGVIAALFGPIKYGILPDHLHKSELPAGNALVEGATFLAILLGIIVGGFAMQEDRSSISIVVQLMLVAFACWGASLFIPASGVAAPYLHVQRNPITSTFLLLKDLRQDPRLFVGGMTVSWFWLVGAVSLSLIPFLIKTRLGGDIIAETAVNALFAIGIALGSLGAAWISRGRFLLLLTPLAAFGMGACLWDIYITTSPLPREAASHSWEIFFASQAGIHLTIDIVLLAASGGIFVVPIFSAVQSWAKEEARARVVAGVNVLTALFMVGGTLLVALLQLPAFGVSEPLLLGSLGLFNLFVGGILLFVLPDRVLLDLLALLFRLLYRLDIRGLEHLPQPGTRAVIAVNHLSFLDAPALLSVLKDRVVFAMDWQIAQKWWVKPFLACADVIAVDPTKPLGTRTLIQKVKEGCCLVIFPEGRITITGSLMKIYDGAAMIADKADAIIIPARLEGFENTHFSRLSSSQVRRKFFPKARLTFLPPCDLKVPPHFVGRTRRRAAASALYDMMSDLIFQTSVLDSTLFETLCTIARRLGAGSLLLEDPLVGPFSLRKLLIGSAILSRPFAHYTQEGENVGILLPTSIGAALAFFGLQQIGRVPAMLNATAGLDMNIHACHCACVKRVVTSRAFIQKAHLEPLLGALAPHVQILYLEDIKANISLIDRLRGLWQAGRVLVRRNPQDPAVVLFTSGSEGTPKGVVLSHRNLLANIAQIHARFDMTSSDILLNALPVFHSFGLTIGLLFPLLSGIKAYQYPSPLHYRQIPELIYGINATIFFATDTFLNGYAKAANPYDFRSLRYLIAGAEPVKASTRTLYLEQFGLRILEGYGVTETSPVLAVNTNMHYKSGTVGRLMPGVLARLEPVPGYEEGGRLFVRGPNIMIGLYRKENPGIIEPPSEGWHDTGDIVSIDAQGFVTIKGRAKRFAKIAGEMVSLSAIEALCADVWPHVPLAILALPDVRKGERILLAISKPQIDRSNVAKALKALGASDLMIPAEILYTEEIPLLGSGKTDYRRLTQMVQDTRGREA